jgi:hypothetical protein
MPDAFLTALRAGRPEHTPEPQGVVLHVFGEAVVFEHADDSRDTYDLSELKRALEEAER